MKQISRRAAALFIMILFFSAGTGLLLFRFAVSADDWATYPTNRHIYTDGSLVKAGTITDRNGTILAQTTDGVRSFAEDASIRKATFHAVGDLSGKVATGVHSAFLKQLTGYDIVNGTYNVSGEGKNIELTLDADLCATALQALGSYSGTVGVYNYTTGEIICMVSTPTIDPYDVREDSGDEENGLYVNRLLSGVYAPGSVFKLVTTTASLDNKEDCFEQTYTCDRGAEIEGEWVSCLGNHGTLTLGGALTKSCNAYFSQLAVDLGPEIMTKTAEKLGFNKSFYMDGIQCTASRYDVSGARNIDLAWSGMGQQNDMVNPYHYMLFMGAIANEGVPITPYLVENIYTPSGIPTHFRIFNSTGRMLSKATANELKEMMRNNVLNNYGDSNFPGLELCAKTGTAEIGAESPHSWFVGFSQLQEKPYAFVVIAENAGSGIRTAAKIANKVLQAAPTVE